LQDDGTVTEGNLTNIVDTTRPSLRGPDARSINGRFWFVTGALLLVIFALIIVVSFISATNDNARIDRLKNHGVSVAVTVTSCVGNIGGSGSNAAGYTCRGSYRVNGVRYLEIIGSKTTLSITGTKERAVVDPARPSTIELASAVQTSSSSSSVYLVPSLLALSFVVLTLALLGRRRFSLTRANVIELDRG
jgi:hypothetical protein